MIDIEKIQKEKPIKDLLQFGIINIDKPQGPTSFSVTDYLRKSLNLNKTSHMGTLDPAVTGVLPILLGRACRLSDYFMHRNKTYIGIMRVHNDTVSDIDLSKVIKKFIGKIKQLPPVRSRVKRAIREREVISFDILEREDKDTLFETEVQAGTYIRKLIDDIGKEESIGGAHMLELRRTKAGIFDEKKIYNLYEFDEAVKAYNNNDEDRLRKMITPAEIISETLPVVQITDKRLLKQLLTGKPLMERDTKLDASIKDKFCVFKDNVFIGTYSKVNEGDIIARAEFVFN